MRLPRRPYVYFRFAGKPKGEILLSSGPGIRGKEDMQRVVMAVRVFAQQQFWPGGFITGIQDRDRDNRPMRKPKTGAALMLWDGIVCDRWTGMSDANLTAVSRFATGLLGVPPPSKGGSR